MATGSAAFMPSKLNNGNDDEVMHSSASIDRTRQPQMRGSQQNHVYVGAKNPPNGNDNNINNNNGNHNYQYGNDNNNNSKRKIQRVSFNLGNNGKIHTHQTATFGQSHRGIDNANESSHNDPISSLDLLSEDRRQRARYLGKKYGIKMAIAKERSKNGQAITEVYDLTQISLTLGFRGLRGRRLTQENRRLLEEAKKATIRHTHTPYPPEEYRDLLKKVEISIGENLESIENGSLIRGGNTRLRSSQPSAQDRAQYGRTMDKSAERVLRDLGDLDSTKVFCDIGHGIGNLVHQAAYTIGCEARGIELDADRCHVSDQLSQEFRFQHELLTAKHLLRHQVGKIELRQGSFQSPEHRKFLTDGVDLLFCNNYNGVFSARSHSVGFTLDDMISGLLTQLKLGARLITLDKLHLIPSRTEANERRKRFELPESTNASFYEMKEVLDHGGDEKLNFTVNKFTYYVYTRVGTKKASFLCNNQSCWHSKQPIPAWSESVDGLIPVTSCPNCQNKFQPSRSAKRRTNTLIETGGFN